jgi:two-component system, chemotaxis family, chemotaxis protein CheY
MKVMVVDDSNAMRRIQLNVLHEMGITDVVEAENGKKAIEKLATVSIDVILLDWNMPVMDGLTTLKSIRSIEKTKVMKIIMCTSESERRKVVEAIKAGANSYIVKPFTPDILKHKFQELELLA